MIDDPHLVEHLLDEIEMHLPLAAITSPALAAELRKRSWNPPLPRRCEVIRVDYAGDEGGIVCRLDFGIADYDSAHFVSMTHLTFDRRTPLFRQIEAYRKHRLKRLRRLHGPMFP
jgi:hypothetical protein